jgi:hypothetical protein
MMAGDWRGSDYYSSFSPVSRRLRQRNSRANRILANIVNRDVMAGINASIGTRLQTCRGDFEAWKALVQGKQCENSISCLPVLTHCNARGLRWRQLRIEVQK